MSRVEMILILIFAAEILWLVQIVLDWFENKSMVKAKEHVALSNALLTKQLSRLTNRLDSFYRCEYADKETGADEQEELAAENVEKSEE